MNEINFNEIWQNQNYVANAEEIIQKATVENKKIKRKIIIQNIILVATAIYIIVIILYFQPRMITTKIGAILTILAIVIQLIANKYLTQKSENYNNSNNNFLNNLLIFKRKQEILQTKIISIYYVLLTIGILIYMIEYAMRMKVVWAISIYGLTILWSFISWFYLRPIQIKKQNKKLNVIINNLRSIKNQFSE